MATAAGVGYSDHRNPAEAGKEAALKALTQAGIDRPDFVFVFATLGYKSADPYTINKRDDLASPFERLLWRRDNSARHRR